MTYEDFLKQEELRETQPNFKENSVAMSVLLEYLEKSSTHKFPYQNTLNFIESLLYNYFLIKGTPDEKILTEILEQYDFNYSISIHNAIYYLLGKKDELAGNDINPLSWPGINNIKKTQSQYRLDTILGTIDVQKASQLFSNSKSSHIFYKKLMGQCYARTYDFLKENRDYHAVLAYMPNFFYGGHYHAYLEKNSQILDIAANAYYESKEKADKILCGEIIKKLSYEEVEELIEKLERTAPEIKHKHKLHVLALYYDKKM